MRYARSVLTALAACQAARAPAPVASEPSPPIAPAPASSAPSAPPIYAAEDAVRDALASPLTLVGVGGWPGYRHLACVYRNASVFVIDVRCNDPETYQLWLVIDSPARRRVDLVADAKNHAAPLSTVQRPAYETFEVSGAAPWAGPPPLALAMSYDELYAHEDARSTRQGGCELATKLPRAVCSHGATATPDAFAAANARFFDAPPDAYHQLVRALVAERRRSYAAVDLGKAGRQELAAWGAAVGFRNGIDIGEVRRAHFITARS